LFLYVQLIAVSRDLISQLNQLIKQRVYSCVNGKWCFILAKIKEDLVGVVVVAFKISNEKIHVANVIYVMCLYL